MTPISYKPDILQNGFEQATLSLKPDYEGEVIATIIRRRTDQTSDKAILYIHGFNDYFFQEEMAMRFNDKGYHFYAVDLRKYGRSYLPHQKFNDIRDLRDYYEEIQLALQIMQEEGVRSVILMGHSTGGLILTLFAKDYSGKGYFDGLILNSPFYEFNKSRFIRMMLPIVSFVGRYLPYPTISGGFTELYGHNLHKSSRGEWEYSLRWKPHVAPKVNLGWIRAIYTAQHELKKTFRINEPILVMHSSKSVKKEKDTHEVRTRDAILNVEHIKKIAGNIQGPVEVIPIKGGIHDLVLSDKGVREKVYYTIFDWIGRHS